MSLEKPSSQLLGDILKRDGVLCQNNAPEEWVNLVRKLEFQIEELKKEKMEARGYARAYFNALMTVSPHKNINPPAWVNNHGNFPRNT
jgi:hypothetical protein